MNKNKITGIILISVLCVSLFSGCGAAATSKTDATKTDAKPIVFRLSDGQVDNYVTCRADKEFAKEVEEKTNGRIKIQVYTGGQLGDEKSVLEQIQFGAIDAMRVGVAPLSEFNKTIGVCALPYIFRDAEHMFKVVDGPVGDKLFADLETNSKFVGLSWFDSGARSFYNSKKDIKTPEDLKGLKIRVQESKPMMDMVKCLGASPTPMAQGDIYSALQSGVVDGAENNWSSYVSMNHYQVAKHFTLDEHSRLPEMILFSKMSFDKLSKDDQKILKDCAKDAAAYERKGWLTDEDANMKKAIDSGISFIKITDKAPWQAMVKPMYDAHPEWADMIKAISAVK